MATVTVTQPAYGYTSTKNSSMSGYTVQWYANGSGVVFYGFRVICHACEGTLYSSSNNPASFNLSSLEDSGHPGPFEIVTDVGSPPPSTRRLRIRTYAVGNGTTSPTEKWYSRSGDGYIGFEIDATLNVGYRFKEWRRGSASGTVVSTSAHYSASTILSGGDGYIDYYAIFEDASLVPVSGDVYYPRSLSVQVDGVWYYGTSLDSNSSYTTKKVYASHQNTGAGGGDIRDYLASLTTSPAYKGPHTGVVYPGQTLSISWSVSNAALYAAFGLRVDHVRVEETGSGGFSKTTTYDGGDGSISISHTVSPDLAGGVDGALVKVTVHLVSAEIYRQVVFTVVGDPTCVPWIKVVQVDRWNDDITVTRYAAAGEHSVSAWCLINNNVYFGGGFPVRSGAFVHGWSMPVSGSGSNRYITISAVGPTIYVTVYVCTHLLVCTDDSLHLECKPPELLCDCSVPPGTTVYP